MLDPYKHKCLSYKQIEDLAFNKKKPKQGNEKD